MQFKSSRSITLDWDSTPYRPFGIREAKARFNQFVETEKPQSATLLQSPLKGFHVRAEFSNSIDNWKMRDKWKDDGIRLVHEMLQSADGFKSQIGDEFFWDGKMIRTGNSFVIFEETPIEVFPNVF